MSESCFAGLKDAMSNCRLSRQILWARGGFIFAAGGPPAALAAKAATATIPIVFSAASDPVGIGLVQSLNRPGGNITGMSTLTTPLGAKSVELFKELMPSATVFAYLLNKSNPSADGEAARLQWRARRSSGFNSTFSAPIASRAWKRLSSCWQRCESRE